MNWKPITPSNSPKFLVKGTELNQAIVPGFNSRYALVEVRTYDLDGHADRGYSVRDAATVSDAEVREGKKPKQIAFFNFEDDAIKFVEALTNPT
jgi:hypothetical protein